MFKPDKLAKFRPIDKIGHSIYEGKDGRELIDDFVKLLTVSKHGEQYDAMCDFLTEASRCLGGR